MIKLPATTPPPEQVLEEEGQEADEVNSERESAGLPDIPIISVFHPKK